jgi:hypothetical protein
MPQAQAGRGIRGLGPGRHGKAITILWHRVYHLSRSRDAREIGLPGVFWVRVEQTQKATAQLGDPDCILKRENWSPGPSLTRGRRGEGGSHLIRTISAANALGKVSTLDAHSSRIADPVIHQQQPLSQTPRRLGHHARADKFAVSGVSMAKKTPLVCYR